MATTKTINAVLSFAGNSVSGSDLKDFLGDLPADAVIYFSYTPAHPSSADDEQWRLACSYDVPKVTSQTYNHLGWRD